jgi:hypothetical protein
MRTTLDIDDDVLSAAKELARQERLSAGQVVSRLLRRVLTGQMAGNSEARVSTTVAGFRPFSSGGKVVTNDQINVLREQEGI